MVALVTDKDEVTQLRCPGVTSIGRGSNNDVIPESRSVSKNHATLTLSLNPITGKYEAILEDLNSSNGTFAGESTFEMHRVNGKESIIMGSYVRFGHSQTFYRLLESAIGGAAPAPAPAPVQPAPLSSRVPPLDGVGATGRGRYAPRNMQHTCGQLRRPPTHPLSHPHSHAHPRIPRSYNPLPKDSARSARSEGPGQGKNMTISINYPTGGR
jgi:hypothetical protein